MFRRPVSQPLAHKRCKEVLFDEEFDGGDEYHTELEPTLTLERQANHPRPQPELAPNHPTKVYTYDFDPHFTANEANHLDIKLWERDPPFFSSRDSGYGGSSRRSSILTNLDTDSVLDFDNEGTHQEVPESQSKHDKSELEVSNLSGLASPMSTSQAHGVLSTLWEERLSLLDFFNRKVPCQNCRRRKLICRALHPYMTWGELSGKHNAVGHRELIPCHESPTNVKFWIVETEPYSADRPEAAAPLLLSSPSTPPFLSESESEVADGGIEEIKRQIIDRAVAVATVWLRSKLEDLRLQNATIRPAGEASSGSTQCSAHSSSSSQHGSTQLGNRGLSSGEGKASHKRKASDRKNEDEDEDDDDRERPPPSKARIDKGKGVESPKFACPYFKYNQAKYKDWRGCPGPGWPDVHRLKEHLYRKHRQPKYRCVRCWQPFEDEQTHMDHQRNTMSCPLKPMEPIEGFDAGQESRLKSRKRTITGLSEVEKWKTIFQILFPHIAQVNIPSPFYEYEEESVGTPLSECEEYILKEVPLRLRHILAPEFDREWNIVEEGLKRKAIDSLKTVLVDVFREFRQLKQTTDTDHRTSSSASSAREEQSNLQLPVGLQGQVGTELGADDAPQDGQTGTLPTQNVAEREQWSVELPISSNQCQDMMPPDISFRNDDFDLEGLNLDFLTNPDNILGEGLILENLLPFEGYDCGDNVAGHKKFSDSGYDTNASSPQRTTGGSSEV